MIAILAKPIDQITAADIRSLVISGVPEGERVEFKRELPTKGTTDRDPWMIGQMKIGRHAKDQILKEVVSFANAYGGVLVLGIEEDSDEKPPAAKAISAIPKCEELAERFRIIFRDRVEPKLPSCDIFAVLTSESDDGVVVFRIPSRSRLAPHRVKGTWICPIRRWDRSEEMSMREIQDMTLNVSRGLERLDKRLRDRAARFEQEFERLTSPDDAYGIRITAFPVGDDIRLPTICRPYFKLVEGLSTPSVTVARQLPDQEPTVVEGLVNLHCIGQYGWSPQLRAVRSRPGHDLPDSDYEGYLEIHCDGLVEFGWLCMIGELTQRPLYSDYVLREFANVICWADTLRRYADSGRLEYAVQAAIHVTGNEILVVPGSNADWGSSAAERSYRLAGRLPRGVTPMPRYALDDVSDAGAMLSTLEHDLCNAVGKAFADNTLGRFEVRYEQG
ncbi:MAG: ATP-binding protein [Gemmatimonadota bacterium]|nr:ATP-binding protein [Gemmatimonadota bacterium]